MSYNYANKSTIIKRFGDKDLIELTDKNATGEINLDSLNNAIKDADAIVNSALQKQFETPINPTPHIIEMIANDIAFSRLFTRNRPEIINTMLSEALEKLEQISKGEISINDTYSSPTHKQKVSIDSQPRNFSKSILKQF